MTEPNEIERIFSPAGYVERLLRFEAALARAEARAGLIPQDAATAIASKCDVALFDVPAIVHEAASRGTPLLPLLERLSQNLPNEAMPYVHMGATSQDASDSALVLQMRAGLDALTAELRGLCDAAAGLAEGHRRSVMPGRTFLQHAVPITFGLKAARWLAAVARQLRALDALRRDALVLQFGGAAGTLAALAPNGAQVAQYLADELQLPLPDMPWHAERDRPATVATTLGVTAGVLGKIAMDVVLLSQTEIAEVSEGFAEGKGMSSTMPQKRNPVDAIEALSASRLAIGVVPVVLAAMSQEHERGAGGWQTESRAIQDIFRHTCRAALHVRAALSMLEVNPTRMRANIERSKGTLMAESLAVALARAMPRPDAQRLAGELSASALTSGTSLSEVARADTRVRAVLAADALNDALDPMTYLGTSDATIDRALQSWREYGAQATR
ncbi:MAG TPA: adenylosuccinate lyase family protein [Gemmatimonadaceae bacterium]|nr:adenylosuccinate lyase family protein [Gemmatimonadaceae bacterium]